MVMTMKNCLHNCAARSSNFERRACSATNSPPTLV